MSEAEWVGVDAQGHCLGKGECPIYAELTKGEKNDTKRKNSVLP